MPEMHIPSPVTPGSALVEFFPKWVRNDYKSQVEGRPVGEYRDFVKILQPGETQSIPVREVRPEDTQRFAAQWNAYKNNREQVPDGTPVEDWAALNPGEIQMLRANHVRTIEQLAEMPDVNAQTLMGGFALRKRAQTFLGTMARASRETHVIEGEKSLAQNAATLQSEAADAVVVVDADVNDAYGKMTVIEDNIREAEATFQKALELHKAEIERHTKALREAEANYKGVVASLTSARETWKSKLADWEARKKEATRHAEGQTGPGSQTMVQPPAPPSTRPIQPGEVMAENYTQVPRYSAPVPMEPVGIHGSDDSDAGDPADPAFFETKDAPASFEDGDEGVAAAPEEKSTPKKRGRPKGSKTSTRSKRSG